MMLILFSLYLFAELAWLRCAEGMAREWMNIISWNWGKKIEEERYNKENGNIKYQQSVRDIGQQRHRSFLSTNPGWDDGENSDNLMMRKNIVKCDWNPSSVSEIWTSSFTFRTLNSRLRCKSRQDIEEVFPSGRETLSNYREIQWITFRDVSYGAFRSPENERNGSDRASEAAIPQTTAVSKRCRASVYTSLLDKGGHCSQGKIKNCLYIC